MTDEELEAHIYSCGRHMEAAYERFRRFGVPADRDAAIELMHMRDEAIKARSPAQVARMVSEQERRLDEGVDYFAKQGEVHRRDLETLDRIERQREQAFDAPGTMEGPIA